MNTNLATGHQLTYGSVCSGIEAASLAWEPLGLKPVWFAEIEKFPSALLAYRWPHVKNLGDMTTLPARIRAREIAAPDVLVGGTPCQAFSLTGLRKGLDDPRGQLTLKFIEIADAIDEVRAADGLPPVIIVWENVPGVLNMHDNAYGNFLAGLVGEVNPFEPGGRPAPGKHSRFWRWKKKTRIHVPKWTKHGHVAGRRRAVAWCVKDAQHFGVAQRRKRVFVIASARKGFDPGTVLFECDSVRRDTPPRRSQGEIVAALTANGVGIRGADDNQGQAGHLQPVVGAIAAHSFTGGAGGRPEGAAAGHFIPVAFGGGNTSGSIEVAACLTAKGQRLDFDVETFTLAFPERMSGTQVAAAEDLSPSLMSRNPTAIAQCDTGHSSDRSPDMLSAAAPIAQVRRLTPRECERLQGFPDDYTLIPYGRRVKPEKLDADYAKYLQRGGKMSLDDCRRAAADAPRYKAIGNSMAVPVMRWLMESILANITSEIPAATLTLVTNNDKMTTKKRSRSKPAAAPAFLRPFLKWPGGKYSQLGQILPLLGTGERLIEPFIGAGSVMLNAKGFKQYIGGDTSADLINCYHALQQNPAQLRDKTQLMFETLNSRDDFGDVVEKFNRVHYTALERAAAFLYLNKHAFNGLMRYNRAGKFNTSYGKYTQPYFPVNELLNFSAIADVCTFSCQSFVDTIRLAGKGDVVFCDPPYMPLPGKDGFTQYTGVSFKEEHQWQLVNEMVAAHQRGARVVVTNSGNKKLVDAYKAAGFTVRDLFARRSMSCKGETRETVTDIIATL